MTANFMVNLLMIDGLHDAMRRLLDALSSALQETRTFVPARFAIYSPLEIIQVDALLASLIYTMHTRLITVASQSITREGDKCRAHGKQLHTRQNTGASLFCLLGLDICVLFFPSSQLLHQCQANSPFLQRILLCGRVSFSHDTALNARRATCCIGNGCIQFECNGCGSHGTKDLVASK
jgi:hypothetical protein